MPVSNSLSPSWFVIPSPPLLLGHERKILSLPPPRRNFAIDSYSLSTAHGPDRLYFRAVNRSGPVTAFRHPGFESALWSANEIVAYLTLVCSKVSQSFSYRLLPTGRYLISRPDLLRGAHWVYLVDMLTLLQGKAILCYTPVIICRSGHAEAHRVPNHIPVHSSPTECLLARNDTAALWCVSTKRRRTVHLR